MQPTPRGPAVFSSKPTDPVWDLVRDLRAENAELRKALDDARVAHLNDLRHALKGAPTTPATASAPAGLPAEVDAAMRAYATPGTPLWRELAAYAEGRLAANLPAEAVAAEIRAGGLGDDADPID